MKNIFELHPEFVERDNRNGREHSRVTIESLYNRCVAFLPDVKGKTILDFGCCVGAMGHWCLENGAKHYTGIEIQEEYAKTAIELLSAYHDSDSFLIKQMDIHKFLESNENFYDIIIFIGVIYVFVNTFEIVEKICKICNEQIVMDSLAPVFDYNNHAIIEIIEKQKINNAADITQGLVGIGVRPSETAVQLIFSLYGFSNSERIIPELERSSPDPFNDYLVTSMRTLHPARFGFRFFKSNELALYDLNTVVVSKRDETAPLTPVNFIKRWEFDEGVAKRFFQEALNNIPDYVKVVRKIGPTIRQIFKDNNELTILDVGSAIGYTVDQLLNEGFVNVYGIDSSKDMIKHSKHQERIFYGDKMPADGKWDVIIMNWTLHFVKEREEYLKSIYERMNSGGLLFLTEKTLSESRAETEAYVEFKISRGMTMDEIEAKTIAIEGVLIPLPLEWYKETLTKIGFKEIEIINNRLMFKTLIARKF